MSSLHEQIERLQSAGVTRLTEDSRLAGPQVAFVAIPPAATSSIDGRVFAAGAIAAGAPFVLGAGGAPQGVPADRWLELRDVRSEYPALADRLAGSPQRQLQLVGVTGTDGKTSVTWLLSELLSLADELPCARIGTLGASWGRHHDDNGFTTPPAAVIHAIFKKMRDDELRSVAMEVSSHGLSLGRLEGINFSATALTTLGRDHLDFHGDVGSYHQVKLDFVNRALVPCVVPLSLAKRLAPDTERFTLAPGWARSRTGDPVAHRRPLSDDQPAERPRARAAPGSPPRRPARRLAPSPSGPGAHGARW